LVNRKLAVFSSAVISLGASFASAQEMSQTDLDKNIELMRARPNVRFGEERLALIKDYVAHHENLADTKARATLDQSFARRQRLRRDYRPRGSLSHRARRGSCRHARRTGVDASGTTHERVYDVVLADADKRRPGADGKVPAVGNTVDVPNATWTNTIGDPELLAVWEDPDFDPSVDAFYYARVIEIPTPRWTAYDAKRYNQNMPPEVPMTLQERAYTSPIWYTP